MLSLHSFLRGRRKQRVLLYCRKPLLVRLPRAYAEVEDLVVLEVGGSFQIDFQKPVTTEKAY